MGIEFFPGVKRPGRGVDHPTSYSAEVKERVELCLYSPSWPSGPVRGWTLPFTILLSRISGTFNVNVFEFRALTSVRWAVHSVSGRFNANVFKKLVTNNFAASQLCCAQFHTNSFKFVTTTASCSVTVDYRPLCQVSYYDVSTVGSNAV